MNAAQLGRAMTRRTSKEVKSCFDNITERETGKRVSKKVEHTTPSVAMEGIQTQTQTQILVCIHTPLDRAKKHEHSSLALEICNQDRG